MNKDEMKYYETFLANESSKIINTKNLRNIENNKEIKMILNPYLESLKWK